jgi:precorrin-6A synthase
MMKRIYVIGIGTGNQEHLTVQAINAMKTADLIFIPTKGADKEDLADLRREICERYLEGDAASKTVEFAVPARNTADPAYGRSVDQWHAALADIYVCLLDKVPEDKSGAFLVWGDPSLYDSTLRILERVSGRCSFEVTVIPGITSIQALAASHRIPINLVGKPVEITTGRRLSENGVQAPSTIVMLDGNQTFSRIDDPHMEIFWGAYLGTKDEIVLSGRLVDVADEIENVRAAARKKNGWIMDIYLLRKGSDFQE